MFKASISETSAWNSGHKVGGAKSPLVKIKLKTHPFGLGYPGELLNQQTGKRRLKEMHVTGVAKAKTWLWEPGFGDAMKNDFWLVSDILANLLLILTGDIVGSRRSTVRSS